MSIFLYAVLLAGSLKFGMGQKEFYRYSFFAKDKEVVQLTREEVHYKLILPVD